MVNNDRSFLSHRATWGAALQAAGAAVTVIAEDTGEADAIRSLGFNFIEVARWPGGIVQCPRHGQVGQL